MASKDLNSVALIGRLTRDSELRMANSGIPISNFAIAVNRRRKNGEEWTDEVNYFDIVFMGKGAEKINQYLLKGRQVAIIGELHQRQWTAENGVKRSTVEVYAQEIQLLAQSNASQTAPMGDDYNDTTSASGSYSGSIRGFNQQNNYYQKPGYDSNGNYSRQNQSSVQNQNSNVQNKVNSDIPTADDFEDDDFPF